MKVDLDKSDRADGNWSLPDQVNLNKSIFTY